MTKPSVFFSLRLLSHLARIQYTEVAVFLYHIELSDFTKFARNRVPKYYKKLNNDNAALFLKMTNRHSANSDWQGS